MAKQLRQYSNQQQWEFKDGRPVFEQAFFHIKRAPAMFGSGWVTLALINSALAGNDGANGTSKLGTGLLSIAFGPLVTLYLALTSGYELKELRREMDLKSFRN